MLLFLRFDWVAHALLCINIASWSFALLSCSLFTWTTCRLCWAYSCIICLSSLPIYLLTLGQFTPHPQTPVEVCQKLPTLTIIGVAHQYLVKYQTPMLFLPWIFIITVESTIPRLHFLQPTIILVTLTRVQFHLLLKDLLGRAQIYQDQDLLCTHSLLVTGMPWQNL